MPVTYRFETEPALIRTTCAGNVTMQEVLEHFQELEGDASLPTGLDVLLDLTSMDSIPESDQIQSIAKEIDRLRSRIEWGACAIVARSDVLFGMARMLQVFAESHFRSSNVFRKVEEAEHWLGSLPPRGG